MQRNLRIFGTVAALLVMVAFTIVDRRIRAHNTRSREAAVTMVVLSEYQVKKSLGRVLNAVSGNADALVAARTLESEYAKAQHTYEGIRTFRAVVSKANSQIVSYLVGDSRLEAKARLFDLDQSVKYYADSLITQRNINEIRSGGLMTQLHRDFGPVQ